MRNGQVTGDREADRAADREHRHRHGGEAARDDFEAAANRSQRVAKEVPTQLGDDDEHPGIAEPTQFGRRSRRRRAQPSHDNS
jgi:hypothetical protein